MNFSFSKNKVQAKSEFTKFELHNCAMTCPRAPNSCLHDYTRTQLCLQDCITRIQSCTKRIPARLHAYAIVNRTHASKIANEYAIMNDMRVCNIAHIRNREPCACLQDCTHACNREQVDVIIGFMVLHRNLTNNSFHIDTAKLYFGGYSKPVITVLDLLI